MATHITCHSNEVLPNSFPPPKPAARDFRNFMASEYQASSIMNRISPAEIYAASKDTYDFLQDDIPVLSKPAPTVTSLVRNTQFELDPQLCVTPEKKSPPKNSRFRKPADSFKDPDLTLTPDHGLPADPLLLSPDDSITQMKQYLNSQRTVRFDQNIEVRQMSPENSTLGTSPSQSDCILQNTDTSLNSEENILNSEQLYGEHTLNSTDSLHLQESRGVNFLQGLSSNKLRGYDIGSKQPYHTHSQQFERTIPSVSRREQTHGRSVTINTVNRSEYVGSRDIRPNYAGSLSSQSASDESSGFDSLSSHSSIEPESIEAIDVIASDLRPSKAKSRSKKKSEGMKVVPDAGVENTFARPEFSSTLRVRKELAQLQETEVDLTNAVKQKLKTSDKTKAKVNEKAFSKVNRNRSLYKQLPGVEVKPEDAVTQAEEIITSKVRPTPKTQYKAESQIQKVPDIMEFYERKFQRDTASFTLPGLPEVRSRPQTAELSRAFDVYTHIRGWENW